MNNELYLPFGSTVISRLTDPGLIPCCLDVGNMVNVLGAAQILGERPRYLYFDINLK